MFFDIMAAVAASAIWAAGLMQLGAYITAIGYWPVGILISYLLAFKVGLGLSGLWFGIAIGCACIVTAFIVTVNLIDWRKLIEEAAEQRRRDGLSKSRLEAEDSFKEV